MLAPSEELAVAQFDVPKYPVLLIVGCARSGTTLLLQWLASTRSFAYPTNLMSRFYNAPYIGALIQRMFADPELDFRGELNDLAHIQDQFTSQLGKTRGALAPHEFWYFWRRFFPYGEIQRLDDAALASVDHKRFVTELAAIEGVFDKPLAMKASIANWNILFLNEILPRVLFLHIHRDPMLNAQSLLESRKSFFGSIDDWYSFKPPEYKELRGSDPYTQVAGQVYFTNKGIREQLGRLNAERWLEVDYARFCSCPERLYQEIGTRLGWPARTRAYRGPASFEASIEVRLAADERKRIAAAQAGFAGDSPEPRTPTLW